MFILINRPAKRSTLADPKSKKSIQRISSEIWLCVPNLECYVVEKFMALASVSCFEIQIRFSYGRNDGF
jgi:hypothetical protein